MSNIYCLSVECLSPVIKIKTTPFRCAARRVLLKYKEIKMAENTNQAMELQAMLPDGQGTGDALSDPVSSQQASESIIVQIEEVDEANSSCLR